MRRIIVLLSVLVAIPYYAYAWAQDNKHPIDQWMAKCIEEDIS